MVKSVFMEHVQNRTGAAGFRIHASDHDFRNSGLYDGSGTHWTWLQSDIHCTFLQAPVAEGAAGLSNRYDLCMGKYIFIDGPAIVAASDDLSVMNNYAADRDFF